MENQEAGDVEKEETPPPDPSDVSYGILLVLPLPMSYTGAHATPALVTLSSITAGPVGMDPGAHSCPTALKNPSVSPGITRVLGRMLIPCF
ncbi:hypothetical protein P7K49_029769, partial [Saguinus oedipus]